MGTITFLINIKPKPFPVFLACSSPPKSSRYFRYVHTTSCFCIPFDFYSIPFFKITQLKMLEVWGRSQYPFDTRLWIYTVPANQWVCQAVSAALFFSQSPLILMSSSSFLNLPESVDFLLSSSLPPLKMLTLYQICFRFPGRNKILQIQLKPSDSPTYSISLPPLQR